MDNFRYDQVLFDDFKVMYIVSITEMALLALDTDDSMVMEWDRNNTKENKDENRN